MTFASSLLNYTKLPIEIQGGLYEENRCFGGCFFFCHYSNLFWAVKRQNFLNILANIADNENMNKSGIEIYFDGHRRQYKYFCTVCGRQLGDSAHPIDNTGTREEISNLLCKTCQKKNRTKNDSASRIITQQ
jgi:hypothetical protein